MSLPAATKDISAHPKAGTVTEPVDKTEKEADVERKIKLYGVIQAFRNSRLPSNAQIDETLQYMIDHSLIPPNQLSKDGQRLQQDFRDILETAREIIRSKNADELFQNFVWHTRDVDVDGGGVRKNLEEALPVDKEKASNDGREAVKHLRTLLSLILTNSEVRKLFSDLSLIGRDLLAQGLVKASGGVAPPPERMDQVDASAPRDQFITEGGRRTGPHETPVLQTDVPAVGTVTAHPKDDDVQIRTGDEAKSGNQVIREGKQKASEAQDKFRREASATLADARDKAPSPANDPNAGLTDQARQVKGQAETLASSDHPAGEQEKRGFMDRLKGYRNGVLDRVPQEHKDKASDYRERANDKATRGREWFTEEYFPEERRDQFIYRFKKVIIECQKHSDYQDSIRWLLDYLKEYAGHASTAAREGGGSAKSIRGDTAFKSSTTELRTLLERFANNQPLDEIFNSIDLLVRDSKEDEELRDWFRQVDDYAHKVLLDSGYVLEPDCNNRARELRETGRRFYDHRYKAHFDRLFDETSAWFKGMSDDPLNTRFGQDWARLTKDLLFDSEGSFKFKRHLWNDMRKTVLPTVIDRVGYIPIPRIEYTDDALDLVVENLTLSGPNLFPNFVSLDAHNHFSFSPYSTINDADKTGKGHHEFKLTLSQMQADMRDVAFYFRRKSGFPKIQDSGLADVILGGSGITINTTLRSSPPNDRRSVFHVKDIHVSVDSLKFSIRDSKHDLLYKTLRPLATGLVKKQIQRAIQDGVRTGLEYIDGQLVGVRDRMEAAKASDEETRIQALRDLFKSKKEEINQVKSEASSEKHARHAHFKVVANKRDSILAKEGHPGGWVNRTAERDDVATKGENWHSEAFNIISSGGSTSSPIATAPAPSAHPPATGRGPQPIAVA